MSNKNNDQYDDYNYNDEEELNITDDDIDRELADLDSESQSDSDEAMSFEDDLGLAEKKKTGLLAKIKSMKRRTLLIIILVIFVVLYILIKAMGAKQQNNFDNIQPVTNKIATSATINNSNEKSLALIKAESSLGAKSEVVSQAKTSLTQPRSLTASSALSSATAASGSKTPSVSGGELSGTALQQQNSMTNNTASNNQAALLSEIKTLHNNNQQLAEKLSEVSLQLSQLSQKVGTLHGEVGQIGQQVVEIGQQQTASSQEAESNNQNQNEEVVRSGGSYYVEAVVPGRAWLEAPDNQTVTVAVGDNLSGLGTVTNIDPYSGEVTTSSGQVITYGPN